MEGSIMGVDPLTALNTVRERQKIISTEDSDRLFWLMSDPDVNAVRCSPPSMYVYARISTDRYGDERYSRIINLK
jgi:hypothetical protein